jgi:hypothetical protein
MATRFATYPEPPSAVRQAAARAAENLGYKTRTGPLDANITVMSAFGQLATASIPGADLYLERSSTSTISPNGLLAAGKISRLHDSTLLELTVGMAKGEPEAHANLLMQATAQQLEIDAGHRTPAINSRKSSSGYLLRELVSPLWGSAYLFDGNPLASSTLRKANYGFFGVTEGIAAACFAGSFMATSSDGRRQALGLGIAYLALGRTFGLLNLGEVENYNTLAASPYDLVRIRF